VTAFELVSQYMQFDVTDSEPLQFFHRCEHVVAASPRPAMALARKVQLLGQAKTPGILPVAAIDDIAKRVYAFLRIVAEPNPAPGFAIDQCDLFAGTQVFDCFRSLGRCDPIGDTAAIAAAIEAEYQTRFFRSSAVHERIDAKRTVSAHQACATAIQKVEARPPH